MGNHKNDSFSNVTVSFKNNTEADKSEVFISRDFDAKLAYKNKNLEVFLLATNDQIVELQTIINSLGQVTPGQLQDIQDALDALEIVVNNNFTTLQNSISSLETTVNNQIANLQTDIDNLETTVNNNFTTLQTNIDNLEIVVNNNFTTLQTNIDDLETNINTQITTLQNNFDTLETNINNQISTLQGEVDALELALENKLDNLTPSYTEIVSPVFPRTPNATRMVEVYATLSFDSPGNSDFAGATITVNGVNITPNFVSNQSGNVVLGTGDSEIRMLLTFKVPKNQDYSLSGFTSGGGSVSLLNLFELIL